jgi:serine phosphatase RsbU (regulator of sigma subunit)/streptogramin lyase
MVYDLLIDENDFYWFCSENGIFKLTESPDGNFDVENCFAGTPLEYYNFISLYLDGMGYIWAGTYNQGVVRINPATLEYRQFTTEDGLSDNNVISITENDEKVYLSTLGGGVSVCDIGQNPMVFRNLTMDNPDISNYIYSTFIDSKGRIWFAESGDQVHFLDGNGLTSFGIEEGLNFNNVYCFIEDSEQNIYFSTEGNGIYCYDGESFIHYDESNGMASSEIRSIIADPYDNILILTNEGIDLFHSGSRSFTHFGENYGVAYQEPQLNSVIMDSQGDIWIGTGNGLIKYNPDILFQDTIRPLLFLTGIDLYSVPIEEGLNLFTYRENYFTFRYTGLWYQDPGQILYRFRLQGYDDNWSLPVANRSMTYPMVPPGTYTFEVQLSVDGSIWKGTDNASFTFTIRPPFWRTWWFLISSIFSAFLLILIIFRVRLAALKAQKKELESEVLKATEAIRNQNKELASQKNEIEHQKLEITDSIHYAGRIQSALLPPDEELEKLFPSYFILNKPRDIVSGDYYWVSRKDDSVIIALADCTGHGVPGAFMSILGISFMNEIVNTSETLVAGEILNELREYLVKSLHQTGRKAETRDGIEMALCVIDTVSKKLQYSGANRPLYLVRNKELKEFKGDPMPIGVYDDEINPFTSKEMQLEANDIIYMFSDGYVDQIGGPNRKTFRSRKFKQLLVEIHQKPLEEQKEILEREYEKWRGDIEQIDDIMVMGIRFSGS